MRPKINRDVFLSVYAELGPDATWQKVADEVSDRMGLAGENRIPPGNVAALVSRNRDDWLEDLGVWVEPRKTDPAEQFSSWPVLPPQMRNQWYVRFLEYCARVLEHGEKILPESKKSAWLNLRDRLWLEDSVIRYNFNKSELYLDKRNKYEIQEDPNHLRFYESRRSFRERHPEAPRL